MKSEEKIIREIIREEVKKISENFFKSAIDAVTAGTERRELKQAKDDYNKKFVIPNKPEYEYLRKKVIKTYFENPQEFSKTFFTEEYFNRILQRISLIDDKIKELIQKDPELIDAVKQDLLDTFN